MYNYGLSINLMKLKGAFKCVFTSEGKEFECVCIPIKDNDLYCKKNKQGYENIYLNSIAIIDNDNELKYSHKIIKKNSFQNKIKSKRNKFTIGFMRQFQKYSKKQDEKKVNNTNKIKRVYLDDDNLPI